MSSKGKVLYFCLGSVMLVGLFAVCSDISNAGGKSLSSYLNPTGFPIVKQPITLKIFIKKTVNMVNPKDMLVFKEYEKKTRIKIDWLTVADKSLQEKMALSVASQDLPDVYMKTGMTSMNQLKYGSQGILVDLNKGLLRKYAPNAKKFIDSHRDVKKSQVCANGAIYSLPEGVESPAVRVARKFFINTKWLKKVDEKMPTTTAEFYEVLKAFKEKDPNGNGKADEIPLTASNLDNINHALRGAFGIGNRGMIHEHVDMDERTRKIRFIPSSPQYKEYLTYMRKLYVEGLLDKEIFSTTMAQFVGKGLEGVVGVFADPNTANMGSNHVREYTGLTTALKGPEGYQICAAMRPYVKSTGAFIITKTNKYPEATLRWVDYFYTDEGTRFYHYGVEGITCKKLANGKYDWTDAIYKEALESKTTFDSVVGKYTPYLGGTNPAIIKDAYYGGREMEPVSYKASMNLMPFVPKEVWTDFAFTEAENDRLVVLKSDISAYVKKMRAEFIFGSTPFSEWDKYVNQLNKMGLKELMKIYQDAYQRYKK